MGLAPRVRHQLRLSALAFAHFDAPRFGEVDECRKPQGKHYAFVFFADAAAAARARQQMHETLVRGWDVNLSAMDGLQLVA